MFVNLDALIKREDLYILSKDKEDDEKVTDIERIKLEADLESKSRIFLTLRKPDIQRETSEWTPERICGLIKSFIRNEIIPSVIIWSSPSGKNFIIDGAHRLSALIAWMRDDYGDRIISETFFGKKNITKAQYKLGERTRSLINEQVGSYANFDLEKLEKMDEKKVEPDILKIARKLGVLFIQVQTIRTNSPEAAEKSFFKINGEATPINDTEALILKSRKKPNSISARAIIHSGTGYEYWSKFDEKTKIEITSLAFKINELLFQP